MNPQPEAAMDVEEIKKILPHRYPFLLVDRVVEWVDGEMIRGYKNVTANEGFFQGHFPGRPVMPGVLVIEAMAQLGAILQLRQFPGRIAFFAGIEKARFKRIVVPGDRLDMEIKVLRKRERFASIEGRAKVDGQVVAEAVLMSVVQA